MATTIIKSKNQEADRPVSAKTKLRQTITLCLSCVLTAAFVALLAIAFTAGFPTWAVLTLFLTVIVVVVAWSFYYMARLAYNEERRPNKHKHTGHGNRKNRRNKAG